MTSDPHHAHPPPPRLEVICGPMFAGKTTRLIQRLNQLHAAGRSTLALKPALDDRYHPTDLATHDRATFPARTIHHPAELLDHHADVIGLDEAHFFETGLLDAARHALAAGTTLVLAGLDRTSLNQPFHEMGLLLVEADEVTKLTAPCAVCRSPAVHTVRLFDSTEPIVVGGPGMFENRCRRHLHDPPPNRREANQQR